VSPRFELETAVSKLTWLNKWVSPVELMDAINDARNVLLNSAPVSLTVRSEPLHNESKPPNNNNAAANQHSSNERSLSDVFQRIVEAKEAAGQSAGTDDEDVPLWDNTINKENIRQIPEQVERVTAYIPGNVVN
jgi:hypothetical protein